MRFPLGSALLGIATLLVAAPLLLQAKTKPTPCAPGRFDVTSGPIFTSSASPAVIELRTDGGVDVSGCGVAPKKKIHALKKATTITASWPTCGTFTKVKLTAKIAAPACGTLTGKLRGRKKQKSDVSATREITTTTTTTQVGATTTTAGGATTTTSGGGTTTTGGGSTTTTVGGTTTTTLGGCASNYASCSTFTDLTAPGADRTISFAPYAYSPKCIRIKAGQTVTFSGAFNFHPLTRSSCSPPGLPDSFSDSMAATLPVQLDNVGFHGFYCANHGADLTDGTNGMKGLIEVVP